MEPDFELGIGDKTVEEVEQVEREEVQRRAGVEEGVGIAEALTDEEISDMMRAEMLDEVTAVFVTNAAEFRIPCIIGDTMKGDATRLVDAKGKAKILGLDTEGYDDAALSAQIFDVVGEDEGGMLTDAGKAKLPGYISELGITMRFTFFQSETA